MGWHENPSIEFVITLSSFVEDQPKLERERPPSRTNLGPNRMSFKHILGAWNPPNELVLGAYLNLKYHKIILPLARYSVTTVQNSRSTYST